jgi:hypothetical protein
MSFVPHILVLVISAPASIILSISLLPFWRWLEASTGIESVGHSGPSSWCYLLLYILLVVIGAMIVMRLKK